jgi:hypothetical protein
VGHERADGCQDARLDEWIVRQIGQYRGVHRRSPVSDFAARRSSREQGRG